MLQVAGLLTNVERTLVYHYVGKRLRTIVFPRGVRKICARAFAGCLTLKIVQFNAELVEIEREAFRGCGLEKVELPGGLEVLGASAFEDCAKLRVVTFGNALWNVGACAFAGTALETAELPQSVCFCGLGVFARCHKLTSLQLSENTHILTIDDQDAPGMLEETAVRDVVVPGSIWRLQFRLFRGCTRLSTVFLGEGLRYVESFCFWKLPLERIWLPTTLLTIGD